MCRHYANYRLYVLGISCCFLKTDCYCNPVNRNNQLLQKEYRVPRISNSTFCSGVKAISEHAITKKSLSEKESLKLLYTYKSLCSITKTAQRFWRLKGFLTVALIDCELPLVSVEIQYAKVKGLLLSVKMLSHQS
jgi:hypothetical protein